MIYALNGSVWLLRMLSIKMDSVVKNKIRTEQGGEPKARAKACLGKLRQ